MRHTDSLVVGASRGRSEHGWQQSVRLSRGINFSSKNVGFSRAGRISWQEAQAPTGASGGILCDDVGGGFRGGAAERLAGACGRLLSNT